MLLSQSLNNRSAIAVSSLKLRAEPFLPTTTALGRLCQAAEDLRWEPELSVQENSCLCPDKKHGLASCGPEISRRGSTSPSYPPVKRAWPRITPTDFRLAPGHAWGEGRTKVLRGGFSCPFPPPVPA